MNTLEKAKLLGGASEYDSCGPESCAVKLNKGLGSVYNAKSESGCSMLKTLMTNVCSFDCKYCINAKGCSKKKAVFQPEEVNTLFQYLRSSVGVQGLFLSSGIPGGDSDRITEKMIDAVKLVRKNFNGYVHFKVLPGTSKDLIKQAAEVSDRLSINIEAPTKEVLGEMATCKDLKNDIMKRQRWISELKLKSGQVTQMIVNDMATDKDVLKMADSEYESFNLKRVYYSAFRPVKNTAMENHKGESLLREHRLYNVDFLIRTYDYKLKEFKAIMDDEMLPRNQDPKMALAIETFDKPIDINEASYEELIRIPGIGLKTAKKIVDRKEKITKYEQLHQLGGWIKRAKPFIEVDGKRQKMLCEW